MIETSLTKVKINEIVQSQIPEYIDVENPLFGEFLQQYYYSQEYQGGPVDIADNLSDYKSLDFLNATNLTGFTSLTQYITGVDETIYVDSTKGWPQSWGLLKIDNEIITYTGIGTTSFTGCVRGFSGIEANTKTNVPEYLTFSSTGIATHGVDARVENLSNIFLREFLNKLKVQILPGFQDRFLNGQIDQSNFIRQAKDFYKSKGTEEAFKILFKALYAEKVEMIKPQVYMIRPSDADWVVNDVLVCGLIDGDPKKIEGQTLFQDTRPIKTSGAIYDVKTAVIDGKRYYKVAISKGTTIGTFQQVGKTFVNSTAGIGATILNVDSTVGFGTTGTLDYAGQKYEYTSKNYTQFLGVATASNGLLGAIGIGSVVCDATLTAYSYEDGDLEKPVRLNILGAISEFDGSGLDQVVDTKLNVTHLGIDQKDQRFTSWIYNTTATYSADAVISKGSNVYEYTFFNTHVLYEGDKVFIIDADGITIDGTIVDIISDKVIQVNHAAINLNKKYKIRRKIKTRVSNTADVQNTYASGTDVYVASNSLPSAGYSVFNPQKRIRTFTNSGITTISNVINITNHHFNDGEVVVYKGDGLSGVTTNQGYYVGKIDDDNLHLSLSLENVRRGQFIDVFGAGDIASLGISTHTLTPEKVGFTTVGAQKVLRKFPLPEYGDTKTETSQGSVGLFANGVEIYSYKSTDKVFYGSIETVDVLNKGSNYDVINPPRISITQDGHTGAASSAIAHVSGTIQEFLVDSEGLDYIITPSVAITGGNGSAKAEAKMKKVAHEVEFNSSSVGGVVNTATDIFTFETAHGFKNGEELIYTTGGTTEIGIGTTPGKLVNFSSYFAIKKNDYEIALAETRNSALAGINTIDITTNGGGTHKFATKERRLKVDKVLLIENDTFSNKENRILSSKVNFYTDQFNAPRHGYETGDKVLYTTTDTAPSGLTNNTEYYIIKIDDDNFRLSTTKNSKEFIDFTTAGVGTHIFNYPPVVVTISGQQGITTANATATPIIRGSIDAVQLLTKGSGYGSTVINDNFRPDVRIIDGSDASLEPLIVNGRLSEVIIKGGGKDFFSTPDIVITGDGVGAKAKAVVNNGSIVRVDVIDPGAGYVTSSTTITAVTPGEGYVFAANLKEWTVNQVERYAKFGDVNADDGFLETEVIDGYGNPYVSYYVPRNLRTFKEDDGTRHSPILGYAYDGHPIYGPYAYQNADGSGGFKYLEPGYSVITGARAGGPPISQYPAGFFIEDYTYLENRGDLDEHNGRFAVTPEYPNGVYAYYTTVQSSVTNNIGDPFNGTRKPVFPYVIGDTYNSKPDAFNFEFTSTQDLDPVKLGCIRNTNAYKMDEYEFVTNGQKGTTTNGQVLKVTNDSIDSIKVVEGGQAYNVGDRVVFDNSGTGGFGAIAQVSDVVGVAITDITSTITTLEDVDLVVRGNSVTAISTVPHGLSDGVYVSIIDISSTAFNAVTGTYKIKVDTFRSGLSTSMTAGGMTTSVSVSDIVTKFNVDDVLQIDDEQFVVMNLDIPNNKLRLLRNYDGTSGAAHTNGAEIVRLEKRFDYQLPKVVSLSSPEDRIHYFDAEKSVGVGLTAGVGIGTTISYVGAGNTTKTKFIPTRTIYMPNNPFIHGEEVHYSPGAGTSLTVSSDGTNEHPIFKNVFIQKISNELVGIVSERIGINSESSRLYFNGNIGVGNSHFFRTKRDVVNCNVRSVDVIVGTGVSNHNLRPKDIVDVTVVSTATSSVTATYDTATRFVSIGASVNPRIDVTVGDTLEIDTSSSTLSNTTLQFFLDPNFQKEFVGSGVSAIEITEEYSPGITSAKTSVRFTPQVPEVLYYQFVPTNTSKKIETNKEINEFNKIVVSNSKFTGRYPLTTTTDYTFTYNVFEIPERTGYTSTSDLRYITNSKNANGPVGTVELLDGGKQYTSLPKASVASTTGRAAVLRPFGSNIGSIDAIQILEFGYDYPSDRTLQPQVGIPQVIVLKNNYSVDQVGVTSAGSKYTTPPDLIVYNSTTDTVNTTPELIAQLNGTGVESVKIINPGGNMSVNDNNLLAVNNSNGIGIISATYSDPNVTLRLQTPTTGFTTSDPLPFQIGDQVFVENVGVSTGNGYNSADYEYQFFRITGVNTAFGLVDQATITYPVTRDPGDHDGLQFGSVAREQDIAKFDLTLKEGEFISGEEVYTKNVTSKVVPDIKQDTDILRVTSLAGINTGDILTGRISGASGEVQDMSNYSAHYNVRASAEETYGWETNVGFLDDYFQRIQDSDYYQQFSYSLKSEVGIASWSEPVDSLGHIAGFKKHSDLLIPSDSLAGLGSTSVSTGIGSQQSTIILTNDPTKLYCKHDWDLVYELTNDESTVSDKIIFNSNKFGDALICESNRVLEIDDISPQFYDDPDITVTVEIDNFEVTDTSAVKYHGQVVLSTDSGIVYNEAQYCEFTVSYGGTISFNNQYSDISDAFNLGNFFTEKDGNTVDLYFEPFNNSYTYDITLYKETIGNDVGVGSTSFGHVVRQGVSSFVAGSASPTEQIIQSIDAEQFKSGQVVVSVIGEGEKSVVESVFLGIGSTAKYSNFGAMDADVGLGTFSVGMTGTNDLQLKFLPLAGVGVTISMLATLVGVATTVPGTGIPGTIRDLGDVSLQCTRTEIAASASPTATTIASAGGNTYTSVKYLVEIENTTDNEYSFVSVAANIYGDVVNYVKYNNVSTATTENRDIQNIDMIESAGSGILRFTPQQNRNYIIRTSEVLIDKPDNVISDVSVSF